MAELITFNLKELCDFRMHVADILDKGIVEHTSTTLAIMRTLYGADDTIGQNKVNFIETKLQNSKKNRPRLHAEILASALAFIRMKKAQSILDIAYAQILLIRAIAGEDYIKKIVGVDTDQQQIKVANALAD